MKCLEHTESMVFELTRAEMLTALMNISRYVGTFKLEGVEIDESNDSAYARIIIARDIKNL